MSSRAHTYSLTLFGLAVIASGLLRYLSAEGGEKGLWFGLVMGALALLAGRLCARGRRRASLAVAIPTLGLVGGWFCYESFVLKGLADAEPRQLILIALTLATAALLVGVRERGSAGLSRA